MEVRVENLKVEITKLSTLIKEYEDNYLNIYNEFSSISFFWQDNNEKKLSDELTLEKLKINTSIQETKEIQAIYTYIIEKYEKLGEKISFDLTKREELLVKFNNYIEQLKEIIKKYEKINATSCPKANTYLLSERKKLIKMKENAIELKEKYKETLNYIEEIEREVNLRISKIKIEILKID